MRGLAVRIPRCKPLQVSALVIRSDFHRSEMKLFRDAGCRRRFWNEFVPASSQGCWDCFLANPISWMVRQRERGYTWPSLDEATKFYFLLKLKKCLNKAASTNFQKFRRVRVVHIFASRGQHCSTFPSIRL